MTLAEFFAKIESANAHTPGVHTLYPGLTDEQLQRWYAVHPGARLPEDLLALLRVSNGLGLHQEWYASEPIYDRGAVVFYCLDEIGRADLAMYDVEYEDDSRLPSTRMACAMGPDGSVYYGFDSQSLQFWKFEPIGCDESEELGPRIDPLLDLVI